MSGSHHLVLAAALLAASPSAKAANDCTPQAPVVRPTTVVIAYDPFDAAATSDFFAIDITATGCPANRNFFLELDPVDASQSDGTLIRFSNGGASILAAVSDQRGGQGHGRDDFFNVKVGTRSFYLNVARGQVVPPGDYRVPMTASVRTNNGNKAESGSSNFDLVIRVGAAIGLAPASGSGLDLGELRDGGRALSQATFDAYANVPYRLTVRSDYGYVMRRNGIANSPGPAYQALLDETALTGAEPSRDFAEPPTGMWRRRHSLDVQVPSITAQAAGRYRDYLTVEITPRLGG